MTYASQEDLRHPIQALPLFTRKSMKIIRLVLEESQVVRRFDREHKGFGGLLDSGDRIDVKVGQLAQESLVLHLRDTDEYNA